MDIAYQTVLMAALLHDTGKFFQKGTTELLENQGQHPGISARFVRKYLRLFKSVTDTEMLEELVLKHHANSQSFPENMLVSNASDAVKRYALLISEADNLSSKERDSEVVSGTDFRTRPMSSIFSTLSLSETLQARPASYKMAALTPSGDRKSVV